jgi:hypothetical protein
MILKNIFIFSKYGKQLEINLNNPKGASFGKYTCMFKVFKISVTKLPKLFSLKNISYKDTGIYEGIC